jgi:hypothetical protein
MLLRLLKALMRPAQARDATAPQAKAGAQRPQSSAQAASALVRDARALQYARDFDGAGARLESALASDAATSEGRERAILLIELALCRLRRNRLAEAARALEAATIADPGHPLLEKLGQFPSLLEDSLQLSRLALPPMPPAVAGPHGPVSAVYFFLETPATTEEGRAGYFGLMRQSIASLKSVMPGARAVLLTDQTTRVPDGAGFDAVVRLSLDPRALVHSRLLALAGALGEPPLEGDLVLLDPDTVVARDFRDLYGAPFDLAFTLRSDFAEALMDHEPFNVGVIFVRAGGMRRARGFFALCVRCFEEVERCAAVRRFYGEGLKTWRGDQVLPAAVIGRRMYLEHVLSGRTNLLEIEGCAVGFVESRLYNNSGKESAAALEPPYILHYKGEQKWRAAPEHRGTAA